MVRIGCVTRVIFKYVASMPFYDFDIGLTEIAKAFGGEPLDFHCMRDRQTGCVRHYVVPLSIAYLYRPADRQVVRFQFHARRSKKLIEWFNNPYIKLTVRETKKIGRTILKHAQLKEDKYTNLICKEFEKLIAARDNWDIA